VTLPPGNRGKVLAALASGPTGPEPLARKTGLPKRSVHAALTSLVASGQVRKVQQLKDARKVLYALAHPQPISP
jgi:DNA-binding IclR family transcriptional regulator